MPTQSVPVRIGNELDEKKWKNIARVNDTEIFGFFGAYRFLSNFYPSPVLYCGVLFPSAENAYQAAKFNPKAWYHFLSVSPESAKHIARCESMVPLRRFTDDEWKERRNSFMTDVTRAKYGLVRDGELDEENEEPSLLDRLMMTGGRELIEANWWEDFYWGVYVDAQGNCKGENRFGKILMSVRTEALSRFRFF
jgi:ribA/ribD-fused uncharacterized protein